MGLAQTARDRQRATIGGRANPFQNDDPLGKAFADSVEKGAGDAVKGVMDWWERSSADQEGVSDDLLRLVAGGVRNTTKAWQDASAEQEGITDDILRGVGWTAGKGMQVLDAGSYYGGQIGGKLASAVGVDARIGGAAGNIIGDVLAGGAVAKATQIGKTTARLQRLKKLGATDWQLDAITKGQYMMAHGGKSTNILDDLSRATKVSKKGRKSLKVLESNLKNQLSPELNYLPKDIDFNPLIKETQNIRAETSLKIKKGGSLDQIESSGSTLADLTTLKDDPRVYNVPKLRSKLQKFEAQIEGAPALEWHHKNMKTLTRPFVEQMEGLIKAGKATEEHLLNLSYISLEYGVGMGDRASALLQLPRVTHQKLHKLMRLSGVEPTGTALQVYKKGIKEIDNVNDLTKAFLKQIEEISGPMTRQAQFLEQAYKGVDENLLDEFAGLTRERFTLRQLKKKLKGTAKNKQGLASDSPVIRDMASNRIKELDSRIKEVDALRTPVKNAVNQVIDEKLAIAQNRPKRSRL